MRRDLEFPAHPGYVTIAGVGAGGCYDGNVTAYQITRPPAPPPGLS